MKGDPYLDPGGDACEAENVELRAENKRLRAGLSEREALREELLQQAFAENKRLREERDQAICERDSARGLLAKADGAIGRLRALKTELERVLDYWRGLAKSWGDAKDRLEIENAKLREKLADTEERLDHERAANRYLSFGEEGSK